mgnify:CR=1 FL=1
MVNVNEIFHLDLSRTNVVDGQEVVIVRDKALPLFWLGALLDGPARDAAGMMLPLLLVMDYAESRRDEVEAQWDWIDAIRASWTSHAVRPKTYTAGSWGPSSAIALTERDGVHWHE